MTQLSIDECREEVALALAAEVYASRRYGVKLTAKCIEFSEKKLTVVFR
jgi:hypothetical protein